MRALRTVDKLDNCIMFLSVPYDEPAAILISNNGIIAKSDGVQTYMSYQIRTDGEDVTLLSPKQRYVFVFAKENGALVRFISNENILGKEGWVTT